MARPIEGNELSLVPYTTRESNEIFLCVEYTLYVPFLITD